MSTCFRRNFQISGGSGKSALSLIKWSKNQKSPDFSGSFKSNERKLRPVKISAQLDENWRFFITSKVSTHFAEIQKHRLRNPKTGSFLSKRKGDQPPKISAQSDYWFKSYLQICQVLIVLIGLVIKNPQFLSDPADILTQRSFRSFNLNEPKKLGLFRCFDGEKAKKHFSRKLNKVTNKNALKKKSSPFK